MKIFLKKITTLLKIAIVSGLVVLGTHYVLAVDWTPPTDSPPHGNTPAPLNVSSALQWKNGVLQVNGLRSFVDVVADGNMSVGYSTPPSSEAPGVNLDVAGQIKIAGGGIGVNKILSSDASGVGSWKTLSELCFSNPGTCGGSGGGSPLTTKGDIFTFDTANQRLPVGTVTGMVLSVDSSTATGLKWINAPGGISGLGAATKIPVWTGSNTLGSSMIVDNGTIAGINTGVNITSYGQRLDIAGKIRINDATQANNKVLASDANGVGRWDTLANLCAASGGCGGGSISGTVNKVAKFNSTGNNVTDSQITDNGTGVGIGEAPLAGKILAVNGTIRADGVSGWFEATSAGGFSSIGNLNLQSAGASIAYLNPFSGAGVQVGGPGGPQNLTVTGNTYSAAYFYSSDKNLKKNIIPLQDSLSKILQLKGVSFNWKDTGRADAGLIAQDVEKVYPELVSTNKTTGLKSVEYGNLVAPLIEAVKEQQKEIETLKAQIKDLQNK